MNNEMKRISKNDKQQALVPRLRFPEFRDGAGWQQKTIERIARVTQGGTPSTSNPEYWDGTINWLTPAEMGKGDSPYISSTKRTITEEGLGNCSSELLPAQSVIISTRAPIGHLAINTLPMAINQGCRGFVPVEDAHFLYYALLHAKPRLMDLGAGNTFKELSGSALKGFLLPTPKPPEQQKIADCLGSLDDLIAAEGRKLAALRDHKKGLMQQLFPREGETRPRLRFPEFRDAGEWEKKTLGEIATISKGKGISKADIVENGATPCVRYGELYTIYGEIIDDARSTTNLPVSDLVLSEAGDVIIPASGETKEDIATCACIVDEGVALGGDLNIIRSPLDGQFFSYYLNGSRRRELAKVAQGDTVAHLYPTQLSRLDICIPPDKNEQQRIADCLSSLDALIAAQVKKLDALRTHKRGLMQQLFPSPEADKS